MLFMRDLDIPMSRKQWTTHAYFRSLIAGATRALDAAITLKY